MHDILFPGLEPGHPTVQQLYRDQNNGGGYLCNGFNPAFSPVHTADQRHGTHLTRSHIIEKQFIARFIRSADFDKTGKHYGEGPDVLILPYELLVLLKYFVAPCLTNGQPEPGFKKRKAFFFEDRNCLTL